MPEIPRIDAFEMEWPVTTVDVTGRRARFNATRDLVNNCIHPDIPRFKGWLGNAFRFYEDHNNYPETAGPEETELVNGLVVGEHAAEVFMIDCLARHLRDEKSFASITLHKRLIDDNGTTWGYHKNLSTNSRYIPEFTDEYLHPLALHYANSPALLGAGTYRRPKAGSGFFSFSQKLLEITQDYSGNTITVSGLGKPLMNTRNEPHASKNSGILRYHATCSDAHVSPWATMMSHGIDSLLLGAIEQKKQPDLRLHDLRSDNAALARLACSNAIDIDAKRKANYIHNGERVRYTAAEVELALIDSVERTERTEEGDYILEQWAEAATAFKEDVMLLRKYGAGVAKLALIEKARARLLRDDPKARKDDMAQRMATLDLGLDHLGTIKREDVDGVDIDAEAIYQRSVAAHRRARIEVDPVIDRANVGHRFFNPPETSRATVRAHHIREGNVTKLEWGSITLEGEIDGKPLDPFDYTVAA